MRFGGTTGKPQKRDTSPRQRTAKVKGWKETVGEEIWDNMCPMEPKGFEDL